MQINQGIYFTSLLAVMVLSIAGARLLDSWEGGNHGVRSSSNEQQLTALQTQLDILNKQIEQGDTPNEAIAGQLAALQRSIAALKNNRNAAPGDSNTGTEMRILKDMLRDPDMHKKYARFTQEQRRFNQEAYRQAFESEVVDANWASGAISGIETAMNNSNISPNANLVSADCRTSLCSVKVDYRPTDAYITSSNADSALAQFEFENELLSGLSKGMSHAKVQSTPDGQGGYRYQLTLIRDGYAPPKSANSMDLRGLTPSQIKALLEAR